jgi:hypothetical protein
MSETNTAQASKKWQDFSEKHVCVAQEPFYPIRPAHLYVEPDIKRINRWERKEIATCRVGVVTARAIILLCQLGGAWRSLSLDSLDKQIQKMEGKSCSIAIASNNRSLGMEVLKNYGFVDHNDTMCWATHRFITIYFLHSPSYTCFAGCYK